MQNSIGLKMKIELQLKDIVKNDTLVDKLGLNPWCMAEGADGDTWYQIDVNSHELFNAVKMVLKSNQEYLYE